MLDRSSDHRGRDLRGRLLAAAGVVGLAAALSGTVWAVTSQRDELGGIAEDASVLRDPDNAIRGTVTLTTAEPTSVTITAVAREHTLSITGTGPPGTEHEVPLLGLYPDTQYRVSAEVRDADGARVGSVRLDDLRTLALPTDELPPIEVDVAQPDRMTPGLTLFNSIYRPPVDGEANPVEGYFQVVDHTGRVLWYEVQPGAVQQLVRDEDGNFLYGTDEDATRLISPTGEVLGEWRGFASGTSEGARGHRLDGDVVELDVHSNHHETLPLENGNFVTLSRVAESITYDEPICDDSDDAEENIVGDMVVEYDPTTGEIVQEISFFDIMSPLDDPRPQEPDYCLAGYLDRQWPDGFHPRDWTHANAVIPIDDGDTWLVSNRHTDSLWAIRRVADEDGAAGTLKWELGRDQDWEMLGDGRWFFHQHAPELQPDGTILLYDNGNFRDDADRPYSRAVRYRVDPEARTVEQVWEHRMDPDVYASFVGDADMLDGTVLITHGGQQADCEIEAADEGERFVFGQLVEVDEASGDVVWQLTTRDDEACEGWGIYRSERIPSLYPPGWEVTESDG